MTNQLISDISDQLVQAVLMIFAAILIFFFSHLFIGIAILGLVWLIKLLNGEIRFDHSLLSISLVILALMLTGSWLIYSDQIRGLAKLLLYLEPMICFIMISTISVSPERVRRFIFFFPVLFTAKCLYQLIYYRTPHTVDHHLKYFGNSNVYGQLIAMVCISLLFLMLSEKVLLRKIGYFVLFLIGLTGLFFTYARGAWLGFFAGLIWLICTNLKNRLVLKLGGLIAIFSLGVLLVEPGLMSRIGSIFSLTTISNVQRLVIWKASLQMFRHSPLFGIGLHMFPVYFQKMSHSHLIPFANHAHNNILHILAEFGLIGLGSWLLLLVAIIIKIRDIQRAHGESFNSSFGQMIIAWLITIIIHGLTDYILAMSIPMTLFMLGLGLLISMENKSALRSPSPALTY